MNERELDLLYRISEIVRSVEASGDRFLQTMDALDEIFDVRCGLLILRGSSRNHFEVVFGPHHGNVHLDGINQGIAEAILRHGQPMAIHSVTQEPLPFPSRSLDEKHRSLICIPILSKTRTIGIIAVDPPYRDSVSFDKDIRLLQIVSSMIFQNMGRPDDPMSPSTEYDGDPPLNEILERKLRWMIEKVDPGTESKCALFSDITNLVQRMVIKWALKRNNHVQTATAQFLGINRNTLRNKMRELNIPSSDF